MYFISHEGQAPVDLSKVSRFYTDYHEKEDFHQIVFRVGNEFVNWDFEDDQERDKVYSDIQEKHTVNVSK